MQLTCMWCQAPGSARSCWWTRTAGWGCPPTSHTETWLQTGCRPQSSAGFLLARMTIGHRGWEIAPKLTQPVSPSQQVVTVCRDTITFNTTNLLTTIALRNGEMIVVRDHWSVYWVVNRDGGTSNERCWECKCNTPAGKPTTVDYTRRSLYCNLLRNLKNFSTVCSVINVLLFAQFWVFLQPALAVPAKAGCRWQNAGFSYF